ncbi:MAG: large-conductance mechanosensitive channel protein MscL [Ruminococcus sp.]|jgi:large conductance mechanosensitive channel|nr:large-conductance mechanosensitive channel protein MscL [Ruminococcus sp.]MBQ9868996.1 large-conductance mechanosensitive channel protein MscL [Ruminococcus sp.]MCR5480976.1 large-conductance mechanosensitive channel protein MscL [Ruminococcus sp.]
MADEKKEKKGFIKEFKEFISRGSVLDMAVGIIIGGAFTAIVKSLVEDIFTPILGMILAGINFKSLSITIPWGSKPQIYYGLFLEAVVTFLLTAFCVFLMIKAINKFRKKKEEEPEAPDPQIVLLTEIRDLLANGKTEEAAAKLEENNK